MTNLHDTLVRRVNEFKLSVRSANCLKNKNIYYIGDLAQLSESEMLSTPSFGEKSLNEIKDILRIMGLRFGMTLPSDWKDSVENNPKNSIHLLTKTIDELLEEIHAKANRIHEVYHDYFNQQGDN